LIHGRYMTKTWNFPSFDQNADSSKNSDEEYSTNEMDFSNAGSTQQNIPENELVLESKEQDRLNLELQNKVQLINEMIYKLQAPLLQFDQEMQQLFVELIQQIALKLIQSELKVNPEYIKNIFISTFEHMPQVNLPIQVTIHPDDRLLLESINLQQTIHIQVDPSINRGDITLKTEMTELVNDLKSRIHRIINHDE
jgi:flagellar biosynthesis/type III secretory pathway protein FliH